MKIDMPRPSLAPKTGGMAYRIAHYGMFVGFAFCLSAVIFQQFGWLMLLYGALTLLAAGFAMWAIGKRRPRE